MYRSYDELSGEQLPQGLVALDNVGAERHVGRVDLDSLRCGDVCHATGDVDLHDCEVVVSLPLLSSWWSSALSALIMIASIVSASHR